MVWQHNNDCNESYSIYEQHLNYSFLHNITQQKQCWLFWDRKSALRNSIKDDPTDKQRNTGLSDKKEGK